MKNPNWRSETGKKNAPIARAARQEKLTMDRRLWNRLSYEPNSGCWLWEGALQAQGYGVIGLNARTFMVHRLVYEMTRGPIPAGLVIDHVCCTPACCNPDHLEAVSYGENTRRGYERGGRSNHVWRTGWRHTPETKQKASEARKLWWERKRAQMKEAA